MFNHLIEAMLGWRRIQSFGMETLQWWEVVVKPGIRKLAGIRAKEMSKDRKSELNLLLVRQAYLNKKVKLGHLEAGGPEGCPPSDPALVSKSM